ncbi:hypothetical protein ABPG72_002043 [Tetrahymena utriculariae]
MRSNYQFKEYLGRYQLIKILTNQIYYKQLKIYKKKYTQQINIQNKMSKQVKKGQVEKKIKAEEEKKKVVQQSSDDSDESSSEDEKPVVANKKNQKVQEKAAEKATKAKKQISESSDDSESEEEKPVAKKAVAPAKTAPATKKLAAKKESSDSDDSDSEDEKPAPKKAVAPVKTAPAAKKLAAKKESSDSDDSESEEEKPVAKKAVAPAKTAPAAKKLAAKKESSDSDESESEEEKPAAKKAATKPAATKPTATKQAAKKQESEDDEDSDEESEEQKPTAKKAEKMEVEEESSEEQKPIKQDQPIQKAQQKPNGNANSKQGGDKFSNEVIVKGLSFDADENDIGNFLDENCGPVSRVNLLKNEQGRSKGIAFISFETEEGCNKAVELSNSEFMSRFITIEKTKPKADRPAHLPVDEDSKTIFVGNLSFRTDKETLKKFFASCGKIADTRIAEAEGKSRGFGHVEFEDRSGVENALKKAGEQIDGRPIKVDVAASRGKREGFNRSNGNFNNNRGGPRGGNNSFANERKGAITQFQGKVQSL